MFLSSFKAERGARTLIAPSILCVLAVVYYASFIQHFPFGFYDEGHLYYLAREFGLGAAPNRDDRLLNYLPSVFYLFAPAVLLPANPILAARSLMAVGLVLKVLLAWRCIRRIASEEVAFGAALLLLVVPGPWHKFYVGVASLIVLLGLLRYFAAPGPRSAAWMGGAVGLAVLLRIDAALVGAGLAALALCSRAWTGKLARSEWLLAASVGFAVTLPLQIGLLSLGVLAEFWDQWLVFLPNAFLRVARTVSVDPPAVRSLLGWGRATADAWVFYGASIGIAGALLLALRLRLRDQTAVLVSLWAASQMPPFVLDRPDVAHVTQYAGSYVVAGALLLGRLNGSRHRTAIFAAAGILAALFAAKHIYFAEGGTVGELRHPTEWVRLPNGFEYPAPEGRRFHLLLHEVLARTQPGDPTLALPYLPGAAFATETRLLGREALVEPSSVADREAMEAYYSLIETNPPQVALYQPTMSYTDDTTGELRSFDPELHQLLGRTFRVEKEIEATQLLAPRN